MSSTALRTIMTVALMVAGPIVLAACGNTSSPDQVPNTSSGWGFPGGSPAAASCIFGATGADVQVQFSNDSAPCAQQEQALSGGGLSWYPISQLATAGQPGTADGETMGLTCTLGKDGSVVTVMDAGGMSYGTSICSSDEQGGWVNTSGARPSLASSTPASPSSSAPGETVGVTPAASGCSTWVTGPSGGDQVIHVQTTISNPTAGEITVSGLDVTFGSGGSQAGSMAINGTDQGTSQIMQASAIEQMTFGFPAVFITGSWASTCQVGQVYGYAGAP